MLTVGVLDPWSALHEHETQSHVKRNMRMYLIQLCLSAGSNGLTNENVVS